jgi:dTDP-4-amino-4,6-dideoxygalactose transaminase
MSGFTKIPFLDLITPHEELKEELCAAFQSALATAGFIGGPMVEEFERNFAEFCDADHCIGVGSGTDALRFALIAAGIREGDIVITVPNTFIATTEAISQAGAEPGFVDVDEYTYNMDSRKLRDYIDTKCYVDSRSGELINRQSGKRVAAVIPVHLYGQMADMDAIMELAEQYNLMVFEDACQAHGAEYFSKREGCWKRAGSMGRAAAFSFYPGKNLGACGEAGAVTTNDEALETKVRILRDHGQAKKYYHDIEGYNGRLDAIQAGILQTKLKHLTVWNEQRQQHARYYQELLGPAQGVVLPEEPIWSKSVYHLYVIRVQEREQLQHDLNEVGIGTGIHYPVPLHLQKAYTTLGYRAGDFPVAERCAAEIVSLPMFPGLSAGQQKRVAEAVQASASRLSNRGLARAAARAGD